MMKKKTISIILVIFFGIVLASCNKKNKTQYKYDFTESIPYLETGIYDNIDGVDISIDKAVLGNYDISMKNEGHLAFVKSKIINQKKDSISFYEKSNNEYYMTLNHYSSGSLEYDFDFFMISNNHINYITPYLVVYFGKIEKEDGYVYYANVECGLTIGDIEEHIATIYFDNLYYSQADMRYFIQSIIFDII